jgi:hypothetical protein
LAIACALGVACALDVPTATPPASAEPGPAIEGVTFHHEPTKTGTQVGFAVDLEGDYGIFTYDGGSTVAIAHFTGPDVKDWEKTVLSAPNGVTDFGWGVAIDVGRAVVIGTDGVASNMYVYELSGTNTWTLANVMTLPANRTFKGIGPSIDMEGSLVAMGAPMNDVDGIEKAGTVYLVNLDTGVIHPIEALRPVANAHFGAAVDLRDGYLAVGSPDYVGPRYAVAQMRIGRAHVFRLDDPDCPIDGLTEYSMKPKPYPFCPIERVIENPMAPQTIQAFRGSHGFGESLALDAGRLYVGSGLETNIISEDPRDYRRGAIYAFNAATGVQIGNKIIGPRYSSYFGWTIAAEGGLLVTSSIEDGDVPAELEPNEMAGEAWIFKTQDLFTGAPDLETLYRREPEPVQMLRPEKACRRSFFGSGNLDIASDEFSYWPGAEVSLSGQRLMVGSPTMGPGDDWIHNLGHFGTVIMFESLPTAPSRSATLTAPTVTFGQASTLTATVDEAGGDGGFVEFTLGDQTSGPVTVSDHTATWQVPVGSLNAGEYEGTAVFTPPDPASGRVTVGATHQVLQASTTITAHADTLEPLAGTEIQVTGTVTGEHGTIPTGSVDITRAGKVLGSAKLDANGAYAFSVMAASTSANPDVTVSYPGDTNHQPSEASLTLDVKPGPSQSPCPTPSAGGTLPPGPCDTPTPSSSGTLTPGPSGTPTPGPSGAPSLGPGGPGTPPPGPSGAPTPGPSTAPPPGPSGTPPPGGSGGKGGTGAGGYGGAGGKGAGASGGKGKLSFTGASSLWLVLAASVLTGTGLALKYRRRLI